MAVPSAEWDLHGSEMRGEVLVVIFPLEFSITQE